jgi:hypothetical protein
MAWDAYPEGAGGAGGAGWYWGWNMSAAMVVGSPTKTRTRARSKCERGGEVMRICAEADIFLFWRTSKGNINSI